MSSSNLKRIFVFNVLLNFCLYSPKNMSESTFCDLGCVSCLLLPLYAVLTPSCKSLVLGFLTCFTSFYILLVDSSFYHKMQISLLDHSKKVSINNRVSGY